MNLGGVELSPSMARPDRVYAQNLQRQVLYTVLKS
jgi:hypothetical protein